MQLAGLITWQVLQYWSGALYFDLLGKHVVALVMGSILGTALDFDLRHESQAIPLNWRRNKLK